MAATLVKGNARISFDSKGSSYSLAKAQASFKNLVQIHAKSGSKLVMFISKVLKISFRLVYSSETRRLKSRCGLYRNLKKRKYDHGKESFLNEGLFLTITLLV
jgi:hypothetical protein